MSLLTLNVGEKEYVKEGTVEDTVLSLEYLGKVQQIEVNDYADTAKINLLFIEYATKLFVKQNLSKKVLLSAPSEAFEDIMSQVGDLMIDLTGLNTSPKAEKNEEAEEVEEKK